MRTDKTIRRSKEVRGRGDYGERKTDETFPASMKSSKNSLFGTVCQPRSVEELLSHLIGEGAIHRSVRMWRGHADSSWKLHSAAYRKLQRIDWNPDEKAVARYERYLLGKAKHRGFYYLDGRELNDWELLARLQHHGAATRLLDTTRSALVGLYLASYSLRERPGILFGIHSDVLGGGEGRPLTVSYTDELKAIAPYANTQTWEPPTVSNRVAAQHSQFLYSLVDNTLNHGSLSFENNNKNLLTIEISSDLKTQSLKVLNEVFDINSGRLFPDLDGFGRDYGSTVGQFENERW